MQGAELRVLSLNDFPPCKNVVENGKTFEANAKKKAQVYAAHTKGLALGDDSGLMVNRLNGKPGIYSARFAGSGCTYEDNNRKLLRILKNVPASGRGAKFVCVIAIYDGKKLVGAVKGECRGRIAYSMRGMNGFGYDPVFIPKGSKKTFAELSQVEKNKISHRGRALQKAKKLILNYLNRIY